MDVEGETAKCEALLDVFRQDAEVLLDGRVVGIVIGQSIVLVGDQVELAARRAAEGQPGVAGRGFTAMFDGELEDGLGHGVVEQREDAAHRGRVQV
jgi:hypothetical protein